MLPGNSKPRFAVGQHEITEHAGSRMRQRGVRNSDLAVLLDLAVDDGDAVFISPSDIESQIAERKREIGQLERLRGRMAIVVGTKVVTVYGKASNGKRRIRR